MAQISVESKDISQIIVANQITPSHEQLIGDMTISEMKHNFCFDEYINEKLDRKLHQCAMHINETKVFHSVLLLK
jgi:hypothetical protein